MKEIYMKYGDRLEIVCPDADKDQWRDVVRWNELPRKHISEGKGCFGGTYMLYRIESKPTYVPIDAQGRVVGGGIPGRAISKAG